MNTDLQVNNLLVEASALITAPLPRSAKKRRRLLTTAIALLGMLSGMGAASAYTYDDSLTVLDAMSVFVTDCDGGQELKAALTNQIIITARKWHKPWQQVLSDSAAKKESTEAMLLAKNEGDKSAMCSFLQLAIADASTPQ